MTPTCAHCGSPWFEPQGSTLRCCDCGTEFGDQQRHRAHQIAVQLAGPNPSHSLVKSIQALVEADEKFIKDSPPRRQTPPKPVTPPVTPQAVTPPVTKTEPEKELTLF